MIDWLRRVPNKYRLTLLWWAFNLVACFGLLAFGLR